MLAPVALIALAGPLQGWQFVRPGILSGISGMALIKEEPARATFLIVHDNKKAGETRAAYVFLVRGGSPEYRALKWSSSGDLPVDLESLTSIPGKSKQFAATTSSGTAHVIEPLEDSVKVHSSFQLPEIPDKANFEGLTIAEVGGKTLMVWGHRGSKPELAKLFWCEFDTSVMNPTGRVQSKEIDVPWPAAEGTRGISDVKLDKSGTLYLTAAADSGDDGPFQSVFCVAGTFQVLGGQTLFFEAPGVRLLWTDQHKIEGFDFAPGKSGGIVFGTDDENLGSYVWSNLWP